MERLAVGAVAQGTGAVAAAAGRVAGPAAVALQVPQGSVADREHVPAAPAVAAVGSSAGDVGFAAEADGAVAARPGLDVDPCAVVEHLASNRDRPGYAAPVRRIC